MLVVATVKWQEEYTEKIRHKTLSGKKTKIKYRIKKKKKKKRRQKLGKGHTYTNPRPGQNLAHAHRHITRAVAAMDSWFALIGAYQHGIVMGPQRSFTTASSTQHIWELLVGNRTAVLLRHAWGRRIMSYPDLFVSKFNKKTLKQGAHIQLSMAATARVIWLCAYVRYCPGRGLVYVCSLILSLS